MKSFGNLRWVRDAVQISQFVGFVENQHLKSVLRELVKVKPGGVIGRNNGANTLRIGIQ